MTRSKVKVTRPLKLEILQFSKSISSGIFNVSWQITTGSETTEQYLTFVQSRFLISFLVFVSRDFELGRVSIQFANAFAISYIVLYYIIIVYYIILLSLDIMLATIKLF